MEFLMYMLALGIGALLLAFSMSYFTDKVIGRPWPWKVFGALIVAPTIAPLAIILLLFALEPLWLIFLPAAFAWSSGWIIGSVVRHQMRTNGD